MTGNTQPTNNLIYEDDIGVSYQAWSTLMRQLRIDCERFLNVSNGMTAQQMLARFAENAQVPDTLVSVPALSPEQRDALAASILANPHLEKILPAEIHQSASLALSEGGVALDDLIRNIGNIANAQSFIALSSASYMSHKANGLSDEQIDELAERAARGDFGDEE